VVNNGIWETGRRIWKNLPWKTVVPNDISCEDDKAVDDDGGC